MLTVVLMAFDVTFTTVTCGKMFVPVPVPDTKVAARVVALGAWKQVPGQAAVPLKIAPTRKVQSNPASVSVTVTVTPGVKSWPAVKL